MTTEVLSPDESVPAELAGIHQPSRNHNKTPQRPPCSQECAQRKPPRNKPALPRHTGEVLGPAVQVISEPFTGTPPVLTLPRQTPETAQVGSPGRPARPWGDRVDRVRNGGARAPTSAERDHPQPPARLTAPSPAPAFARSRAETHQPHEPRPIPRGPTGWPCQNLPSGGPASQRTFIHHISTRSDMRTYL